MRFKSLKSFTLGKSKNGTGGGRARENTAAKQASLTEKPANDLTEDQDKMAEKIEQLSDQPIENGAGPHGPLEELSIEPEDLTGEEAPDVLAQEDESQEEVKMVEMNMNEKPAQEKEPAGDAGDPNNSLSGLFSEEEVEENPLANLIESLPDYTTHEIVEDLNEIKKIIHEWRRE